MKKILRFVFVLGLLFLAACSSNTSTENANKDTQEKEAAATVNDDSNEENSTDSNHANTNDADENEGDGPSNNTSNDEANQSENDTSNNETNQHENNTSTENVDSDSDMDAATILQKSFEAMSEVSSLSMESVINVHEEMGGEIVEEERKFNTVMLLEEPFSQHMELTITGGTEAPITSEIYKVDGKYYIYLSMDDMWSWIPDPQGMRQLSPLITDDTLDNHLSYSNQFTVTDEDDVYLLNFSGTYDEFVSSMFGGTQEMLMEIQRERLPNLEDNINEFAMTIDKNTYYVKNYQIYHGGSASDDFGDYSVTTKGYVSLDNFNQYDDIDVPEEIQTEAVSME